MSKFDIAEAEAYSDWETRDPEAWKHREEEAERHEKFLREQLPELFPEEERSLGGPGSGNFGHAGRPGVIGGSSGGGGFASFEKQALENLETTSRTVGGVSDTSSSAEKPKLVEEGAGLVEKTRANFRSALNRAWEAKDEKFESPEDVKALTEEIAATVSKDLLAPGQGLYRTWETKNNQTPPAEIPAAFDALTKELHSRLDDDPVKTAAWFEKEIATVHPWADGVGRTTKVISAFVLARQGKPLPKYPSREEYYAKIKTPGWESYFETLIP